MESSEGICVGIRMRPLNDREISVGQDKIFKCQTDVNAISQVKDNQVVEGQTYYYDKVFGEKSSTNDVYKHIGQKIVTGVMNGINGTIFAYGQTSSGKTFTMLGAGEDAGVLDLAAEDIFKHIAEHPERDFLLRASFVEIYNENIRDLLTDAADASVAIREDPRKGVYCEASEFMITDFESIRASLDKGIARRTVEATAMNDTSSRSHTIFKLVIESREGNRAGEENDGAVLVATLNLVDLAGSESVRHTGAMGQRAKEGGKINQSLLSLSRVIHSLSQPGTHVNFRDSKLTRLLQPSLSGNARMSIVCCITPAGRYLEETRSTLQFASRAKLVKTHAKVNEVMDEAVQLKRLKKELELLKEKQQQGNSGINAEEVSKLEAEKEELRSYIKSLEQEKAEKDIQLSSLRSSILVSKEAGDEEGLIRAKRSLSSGPSKKRRKRETWGPGDIVVTTRSRANSKDKENRHSNMSDEIIPESLKEDHRRSSGASVHSESVSSNSRPGSLSGEGEVYLTAAEFTALKEAVEGLKNERDSLAQQLELEMGANAEYLSEQEEIRAGLELKILEAEQAKKACEGGFLEEIKKIQVEVEKLDKENQELRDNSRDKMSQHDELVVKLQTENMELQGRIAEFESLDFDSSLKTLTTENEAIEEQFKVLTQEQERLMESLKEKESLLSELEEKTSRSVTEASAMKEKADALEVELRSVQDLLNQASTQKSSALTDFSALQVEALVDKTIISDLRSKLSERECELAMKAEKLTELLLSGGDDEEKDALIQELTGKLEAVQERILSSEMIENQLKIEIRALQQDLAEKENEFSALTETVESLTLSSASVETEIVQKDEIINALTGALELGKARVLELEGVTASQDEVVVSQKEEIQELKNVIVELKGKIEPLEENEKKIVSNISRLNELELTQQEIDNSRKEMSRQVEVLNVELGQKEATISGLLAKVSELEGALSTSQQAFNSKFGSESSILDNAEAMKKRVGQLQTSVDLLKGEKDLLVHQLKSVETENKQQISEMTKHANHLESTLREKDATLLKLESVANGVSSLKESIHALERKLEDSRTEKEELEHAKTHLINEKNLLEDQVVQLQKQLTLENSSSSALSDLQAHNADISLQLEVLTEEKNHLTEDLQEQNSRLRKSKEDYSRLQVELQEAVALSQRLTAALEESNTNEDGMTEALELEVAELKQSNLLLMAKIAELRAAADEAEDKSLALLAQSEESKTRAGFLELELSGEKEQVETLTAELNQEKASNKDLETEVQNVHKKVQELETQLSIVEEAVELKQLRDTEEVEENITSLTLQIQSLETDLAAAKAEKEGTHHKLETAMSQVEQLRSNLQLLEESKANKDQMEATVLQEKMTLEVEVEELNQKISSLQEQLSDSRSSFEAAEEKTVMLQLELDEMKELAAGGREQLDKLTAELDHMIETRDEKEVSFAEARNRIQELETQLSEAREELHLKISGNAEETDSAFSSLKAEISTLENELQQTTQQKNEVVTEVECLKTELVRLEEQLTEKTSSLGLMEERVTALEGEKVESDLKITSLQSTLEEKCVEAAVKEEEFKKAQEDLLFELDSVTDEVTALSTEAHENRNTLEASTARVTTLEKDLEIKQEHVQELTSQLEKLHGSFKKMEDSLAEAQSSYRALQEKTAEEEEKWSSKRSSEAEQVSTLKAKITALETELHQVAEQKTEVVKEVERLKTELVSVEEQLIEKISSLGLMEERVIALEGEKVILTADLEKTKKSLQDIESSSEERVRELEDALTQAENELFQLQQETSSNNYTEETVNTLEEKISQGKLMLDNLKQQLKVSQDELQAANEHCAVNEDMLKNLQKELQVKDKRITHLEAAKLTKDQMQKIKVMKEERKKFQDDAKTFKKQLHQLKIAYDELKDSVNSSSKGASVDFVISDLKFQVAEITGQLNKSEGICELLTGKLKECSTQLQDYEKERTEVIGVLERNGVDITGLLPSENSLSSEELSTMGQQELADAVSKLAEKVKISEATVASKSSTQQQKMKDLEKQVNELTKELEELKTQKVALEKRIDTLKNAARVSREEGATSTLEMEKLKEQVEELKEEIRKTEKKVSSSSDVVSSEVQALEEENIELLQENKSLRLEMAKMKAMVPSTAGVQKPVVTTEEELKPTEPQAPTELKVETSVVEPLIPGSSSRKRAFGDELDDNVLQNRPQEAPSGDLEKAGTNPNSAVKPPSKVRRIRTSKAKTVGAAGLENKGLSSTAGEEVPGECAQS